MVFLLQQITKENSGVIARVADSDGEFLLIETAEYLPQWADPEVCDNRVSIIIILQVFRHFILFKR